MFFKKYIQRKVYHYYLNGFDTAMIAFIMNLKESDVNEIIDFLNYINEV